MTDKHSANPLKLRDRIDRGETADKVDFPDPAAAPLGTDDEAAGTPITPAQLHQARAEEETRNDDSPPAARPDRRGPLYDKLAISLIAVVLAVIVIAAVASFL